jgi:S-adenosylmethionine synthetase
MSSSASSAAEALITSESVTRGHPDKLCDQISDLVLDAFIELDPQARVACETLATAGRLVVVGEFRTADATVFDAVRDGLPLRLRTLLREIGYRSAELDLDPEHCELELQFHPQSPQIAAAVDATDGILGAGDQGIVFGYACDETPELLPLPWVVARSLTRTCSAHVGAAGSPLRSDGKAQVTVAYRGGRPSAIHTVVVSCQHEPDADLEDVRAYLEREIVPQALPAEWQGAGVRRLLNAAGRWTIGGPRGDTGLTGRKIVVDAYGGACPHGGGAFSGKDPSKVDRSGAYMARHLAKHVVAAGLARRCTVQLAYVIGQAQPVAVNVAVPDGGLAAPQDIATALRQIFDLTPTGMLRSLDLLRPRYLATARDGHFGDRAGGPHPWECVTHVEELRRAVGVRLAG